MKNIKWTERIRNVRVMELVGKSRQTWKTLEETRHKLMRETRHKRVRHNEFLVDIIEGRMDGNRGKRRPRLAFIDQVLKYSGCRSYAEMKEKREDIRYSGVESCQPIL
uniref:Endonuclease-reverse transcriptase n=1 Tax=Cacopsylla melanoneura TaxID=428564 RepID=A0A8D9E4A2_9HEMI